MKTNLYCFAGRVIFFLAMILLQTNFSHVLAQTGYCTVIQQPCNGNGILQTTITSGMTPPLTFQYGDPYNTQHDINGFTDTFYGIEMCYYVYITDNYNHYLYLNTGMTLPFYVDVPQSSPAVCPNPGSASITINSGNAPDYVDWYDKSTPFPGTYVGTGNPMDLFAGDYRAKVFHDGCYVYQDSNLYIANLSSISFNVTTTLANCTNGTATVTNLTGGTPPYSYLWSNGATTPAITGLHAGEYQVRVTDAIGCYTELYTYVGQAVTIPVNLVVTQYPTCLDNNGKVMAFGSGGVNPYTYLWSNGETTQEAINLSGGEYYSVIATDVNGCFGTSGIGLTSSTPIAVTYSTTPSSCTAPTGSATLTVNGGTPPYTVVWNTYPVQNGTTASDLPPGNYYFTVTDAVGCIRTGWASIPPMSVISASIYSTNAICPANTGSAGVSCSGVSPFTYQWNNGATTPSISSLSPGSYHCTITDANSCSVTKYTYVESTSPVYVGISSTPATCLYASDGSLFAVPSGGTPPYTYHWSNGAFGNPATNLSPGNYYSYVTDAAGCTTSTFCVVGNSGTSDACYCTVEGTVYFDENANCTADAGEIGIQHIQVHLAPFGYTYTDAAGHYSFLVPSGSYTLSEVVQYIYPLTPGCPDNDPAPVNVTAASGCVITHDFYNIYNPIRDVHIVTDNINYAVPGFPYYQRMIVENDGTVSEPDILLDYDPEEQLLAWSSAPVPLYPITAPWYENSTVPISLSPGGSLGIINTYAAVPTNIPLGTTLNFEDIVAYEPPITNWLNDYTPWNNVNNFSTTVVGSLDPNDKEVLPKGTGPEGTISVNDSVLDYVIRFQNTGTWYAENVVIKDTLDPNLDRTTLRPGYSTHSYTADVSENGVLTLTFSHIHLDWEADNEVNSNGMVTYSIKQKPNLATGTQIRNNADIFFDFNAPVKTNTTLNTILNTTGIRETNGTGDISVYPNPAAEAIWVKTGQAGTLESLQIYDLTGRLVSTTPASGNMIQKISIGELSSGLYFLEALKINGETITLKFVKN
ncbi:MAG TPA: T9SS type A sorting domain-containing protein [Bacteroidales bacterium]|nr:T9SS type A sorting domain-containing protein [Bacteroidales bacterium]